MNRFIHILCYIVGGDASSLSITTGRERFDSTRGNGVCRAIFDLSLGLAVGIPCPPLKFVCFEPSISRCVN
jgi:hypothetical protein